MDYTQINQDRRSVHYFDPEKQIDDATLKQIIEEAVMAPSGYNLQPWQFLVLREPENKERLKALAYGQKQVTDASAAVLILGNKDLSAEYIDRIFADWIAKGYMPAEVAEQQAGNIKANFANQTDAEKKLWATRSTSLVAMNLMLAAQNHGVDSGPMEGFDFEGVLNEFAIPDNYYPVMLVVLGYRLPKENELPRKLRIGFEEKVWLESPKSA